MEEVFEVVKRIPQEQCQNRTVEANRTHDISTTIHQHSARRLRVCVQTFSMSREREQVHT